MPLPTEVGENSFATLLRKVGLSHLHDLLASKGIDDAETLTMFQSWELKDMGIERLGDRKKLLLAARDGALSVPAPNETLVRQFLEREDVRLGEYTDSVIDHGLDSIKLLSEVDESEMELELGMTLPGHRKRFLLRLSSVSESSPSSSMGKKGSSSPLASSPTTQQRIRPTMSTISGSGSEKLRSTRLSSSVGLSAFDGRSPMLSVLNPHSESGRHTPNDIDALGGSASSTSPSLTGSITSLGGGTSVGHSTSLGGRQGYSSRSSGDRDRADRSPARSAFISMPEQRPDKNKRVVGRRGSNSFNDYFKPHHGSDRGEKKLVRVFENGRYVEQDRLLYINVPLPAVGMNIIHNMLTRALHWNVPSDNVYRQGDAAAGGRKVEIIWAINGKPITSWNEIEHGMWVVAGTAHQQFISTTGEKKPMGAPPSVPVKEKQERKASSVTERLSDRHNFTGTQKVVHGTGGNSLRSSTTGTINRASHRKKPMEMLADVRKAVAQGHSSLDLSTSSRPPIRHARTASSSLSPLVSPSVPPPRSRTQDALGEPSWDEEPDDGGNGPGGSGLSALDSIDDDLEGLTPRDLESANKERLRGWLKGQLLGRGSFGLVYQATLADGTQAAVKLVSLGKGECSQEVKQLFKEIRFMEHLDNPHIVRYYGCLWNETENQVEIFLQLMPGGSLASLIAKHGGRLPEELARKYTKQLCLGLDYLHDRKVAHRDVKGANILIDEEGNSRIADFGTSKCIDEMLSRTNGCTTMVGTPYWMAPEVITACDDGAYDTKVDVWSVGCTVVEMVTGQPPWSGKHENMWAAIFHIAQSSDPPPLPDDLSPKLRSFLIRCFERKPAQRPTCKELLDDPWLKDVTA